GTSTGGIIAVGLAMGATAEEICPVYEAEGPKIFLPRTGLPRGDERLRGPVRPKYTAAAPPPPTPSGARGPRPQGRKTKRVGPAAEGGEDEAGGPGVRGEHRQGVPVQDAPPPGLLTGAGAAGRARRARAQ